MTLLRRSGVSQVICGALHLLLNRFIAESLSETDGAIFIAPLCLLVGGVVSTCKDLCTFGLFREPKAPRAKRLEAEIPGD